MDPKEFDRLSVSDKKLEISRALAHVEVLEKQTAEILTRNGVTTLEGLEAKVAVERAEQGAHKTIIDRKSAEIADMTAKNDTLRRQLVEREITDAFGENLTVEQRAAWTTLAMTLPDQFAGIVANAPGLKHAPGAVARILKAASAEPAVTRETGAALGALLLDEADATIEQTADASDLLGASFVPEIPQQGDHSLGGADLADMLTSETEEELGQ